MGDTAVGLAVCLPSLEEARFTVRPDTFTVPTASVSGKYKGYFYSFLNYTYSKGPSMWPYVGSPGPAIMSL